MKIKDLEFKIKVAKANITIEEGNIKLHNELSEKHEKVKAENKKQLILLQDELLKLKEQEKAESVYDKNWRPVEDSKEFFYITRHGGIDGTNKYFCDATFYKWLDTTNNIYQTKADCEKAKQAIELKHEIKEEFKDYNYTQIEITQTILNIIKGSELPEGNINIAFGDRILELQAYL